MLIDNDDGYAEMKLYDGGRNFESGSTGLIVRVLLFMIWRMST